MLTNSYCVAMHCLSRYILFENLKGMHLEEVQFSNHLFFIF